MGSGFWHWLVVNIPANVTEPTSSRDIPRHEDAAGALQTARFAPPVVRGSVPPEGDNPHRYLFTGLEGATTVCRDGGYVSGRIGYFSAFHYPGQGNAIWVSTSATGSS